MKIWLKLALISIILPLSFGWANIALAQILISNFTVENPQNNQMTLKWDTNQDTKSIIYYGQDPANLNYRLNYDTYQSRHEALLLQIEDNKTYYYKILATNRAGESLETYLQSFSSKDMIDTVSPEITKAEVLRTTGDAAIITWTTNEKTAAQLRYKAAESTATEKTKNIGSYKTVQQATITGLKPQTEYYVTIVAKDKAGNQDQTALHFYTYLSYKQKPDLTISNLQPTSYDANLISYNKATISFSTSIAATSQIKYGLSPKKLSKAIDLNDKQLATSHEVTLTDLKPNTTYYYNLSAKSGVYNKTITLKNLSFRTASTPSVQPQVILPQVAGTKITNTDTDSDYDGFLDSLELAHGYNPYGYGRTASITLSYLQKTDSLEYHKSLELKNILSKKLSATTIDKRSWAILVNAYTYGGYSADDIAQAVRWSGKTVHPTIPLRLWQNSSDYHNYIAKN